MVIVIIMDKKTNIEDKLYILEKLRNCNYGISQRV